MRYYLLVFADFDNLSNERMATYESKELDENGEPKRFDTYREAATEAMFCQNGYVIAI